MQVQYIQRTELQRTQLSVKDVVNVKINETGATVELINLIGSTVISTVANDVNTQLDVSALNAGSYLVRVTQKGDVRTKAIQIIK